MPDSPSERIFSAQRKREDNARPLLLKRLAIWAGVFLGIGAVLYGFPQMRNAIWLIYASPDSAGPVTVSTDQGIAVTDSSGGVDKVYSLLSQSNTPIKAPFYTFVDGQFVFWSPDDSSICIVDKDGKKSWVALHGQMGEHDKLTALRTCDHAVFAVLQDQSDAASSRAKHRPSKVISVSVPQGIVQLVPEVPDAIRGENGSVVRQAGGTFAMIGADGQVKNIDKDENAFEWDYYFKNHLFTSTDINNLTIVSNKAKSSFNPAFLHTVPGVALRNDTGEVWAEISKPFGMGTVVLAYSDEGRLIGMRAKGSGRLKGPYYPATPEVIATLERASSGK